MPGWPPQQHDPDGRQGAPPPQWRPERYDPGEHARQAAFRQEQRRAYQQAPPAYPPPQPRPPRRKPWPARHKALTAILGAAALIVIAVAAASGGKPQPAPAATPGAVSAPAGAPAATGTTASRAPAAATVTYSVTGSSADVTYGPAGSDLAGKVPMRKTAKLGSAAYYAITAQLQGGGSVKCEILVNGAVISKATATGGYNISQCEIVQDPFSGKWQDANG